MLTNYFKIAIRNLLRNGVYSIINIAGLSIGIASAMLISLWAVNELSYNNFHRNKDQIYQVWDFGTINGEIGSWRELPFPLYEELKTKHSKIKNAVITDRGSNHLLASGENRINESGLYVSTEFLEIFQFELVKGSASMSDPFAVILTESTAKKLFGDGEPINKIIRIDNRFDLNVTGIVRDVPENSSIKFNYLLPFDLYKKNTAWVTDCVGEWVCDAFQIYVELQSDADPESINKEIKNLIGTLDERFDKKELFIYPMERWNLHGQFDNGKEAETDLSDYVFGFLAIAVCIIAIASINFMNLSTARSERRAREVGIRKISGSVRKDLIFQFLGESILISLVAFVVSLAIVELSLPFYNILIGKNLSINYSSGIFWIVSMSLVLITGILSGSYPAFYLSSFNPASVLKGQMHIARDGVLPRKILVITQFAFSILLITGTLVIYQQINYARSREIGYKKQNLIRLPDNEELSKNYKAIKTELLQTGAVTSMTKMNSPITEIAEINFMNWSGNSGKPVPITNIYADYDYTKTMGIELIAGRDFSEEIKTDTAAVLISRAATEVTGIENLLGATVNIGGNDLKVIGITNDVLMESPYENIEPMYIVLETDWSDHAHPSHISIRLADGDDLSAQLEKISAVFKKLNPSYPFQYAFVDDDFNKKFSTISLTGNLVNLFAFLAIAIACMGLFGLAAFTAARRTKEFGVRKVLGATVLNLVALITRDFTKLILTAFIISAPVAWWILDEFLQRYSYRISFEWWILPAVGGLVLMISLAITGIQALQVAMSNPVEALKNE